MSNIDYDFLRESFDNQYSRLDFIYKDLFIEGELREQLYTEFSQLEPEPDLYIYMIDHLRQAGIPVDEMDMDFMELNEMVMRQIHKKFLKENANGEIKSDYYRPQLNKSETFRKLDKIDQWRNDLINCLIKYNQDTIKDEISNLTIRIHQILDDFSPLLSSQITQKIYNDDLSESIETKMSITGLKAKSLGLNEESESILKARPDPEFQQNRAISEIQGNWRNIQVGLQLTLNERFSKKIKGSPIGTQNSLSKKKERPTSLEEIFIDPPLIEECIDVLKQVEPPVLNINGTYIGKLKGAFCVWIDILLRRGFITKYTDRSIYAELISKRFAPFSIHESMFGKPHKQAEEKYHKEFEVLLSQVYQKRELRK